MRYAGIATMKSDENLAREIIEDINNLKVFHIDSKRGLKMIFSTGIFAYGFELLERRRHTRAFQGLLDGYLKSGRYPVSLKKAMEGKEEVDESEVHRFSDSVDKEHVIKQFVSFALFKKLYIVKDLSKSGRLDEIRLDEMRASIHFFDTVLSDLKPHVDEKTRRVISHALTIGADIISLIQIKERSHSNHLKPLFAAVAMFVACYLLAFTFIDLGASYRALIAFVSLDY
ncbi:hypothetical protein Ga0123462_0384 [Mariprofundus ferrinatatus]|uniref:Uncharacterized protein n=1 Tax=Mariprofundus ferrinatatus TaxID=1921087 RepID=A0A2K8L4U6_9PROT|nr:hypothetical protein [Mariprofundus ferrinatatus]ATX81259.1 hypothetical protein Ga0123462_0384 [Mariprofundus ferrinatatus]